MPSAANDAVGSPHVPADLAALLAELKAVLADATKEKSLIVTQPWKVVGISRSAWYRLAAQEKTPRPVKLSGVGTAYRRSDLEAFVARLKSA